MERQLQMEEMISYCNQYGFIFQGSEIYNGLANTWDYGPLGIRLKNKLKDAWRYSFIQLQDNSFELDSDILMNPMVWKASGHLDSFRDPMIDCKECHMRYRTDTLIESTFPNITADTMTAKELFSFIQEKKITCPNCHGSVFGDMKEFNLMFQTARGVTKEHQNTIYLRPENAQGEYINYLNILRSMRTRLPFHIGQIGKAFRNEITPGNFIFRTIEFEQMEFQTFCKKHTEKTTYDFYKNYALEFFLSLGIIKEHLRFHDHEKLAHYAKEACDIEYRFPFGWGEINGTHNRGDFDLRNHEIYSKKSMHYHDLQLNESYIPHVIESTYGLDRMILALLFECLREEELEDNTSRIVLKIKPTLAPVTLNILPLIKNRHATYAQNLYQNLKKDWFLSYDDTGSIGKRYRRGDAIGIPFAITVDDNSLITNQVTIRHRDSMTQEVVLVSQLNTYIKTHLN